MTKDANDRILLAHGGGGRLTGQLIRNNILPKITNNVIAELADSARLELSSRHVCFTTDSYVVKPLFFNGGDIGKLAVCGTINDLAVAGARPVGITLSLIIEEGLKLEVLERILESAAKAASKSGVMIVAGDTKVVESGAADKIFINTAGIGTRLPKASLGFDRIAAGDKIIVNGNLGDHGMTIICQRQDIKFESSLESDCAAVDKLTEKLIEKAADKVKFMRDPTRGGLAATLCEIADGAGCGIEISEADIPVDPTVRGAADVLGFDVINVANEGKFVAVVAAEVAKEVLDICRADPSGKDAQIIGNITEALDGPIVEMITRIGGRRIVQMPYGRDLPRIC